MLLEHESLFKNLKCEKLFFYFKTFKMWGYFVNKKNVHLK